MIMKQNELRSCLTEFVLQFLEASQDRMSSF